MALQPLRVLSMPYIRSCYVKPPYCVRQLHQRVSASQIPPPTPCVPDPKTFLKLIGRNLLQHAAKIPTWDALFSLTSAQLRDVGVEPARARRYLLWWRDRFRRGIYGVGGDLEYVVDASAKLSVIEIPYEDAPSTKTSRTGLALKKKIVRDVPPDTPATLIPRTLPYSNLKSVKGMKVLGSQKIGGPSLKFIKGTRGSMAMFELQEGMWEQKRGVKLDGGERRRKFVRYKRRLERNRKMQGEDSSRQGG